ncbi:response regulator [Halobellus litoreus]|uniref:histidine kinase n=1 Tax=Halobellus litoreus TaxID=755310 RepID=A0ABD6DTH4_9EURY|nr:response regulator [Halobellus litoreus]
MRRTVGEIDTFQRSDATLVLHVDDEPSLTSVVADYLEALDDEMRVISAQSADVGLERLSAEPIDCVVSDYDMPGKDGLEFLEAVRERYPNLPFLLFTGHGSEEVASRAIKADVTDYLRKDGSESYELLHARVRNAVSHTRAEHRARLARDQLHDIFEHINGFLAVDDDWTVTYWNEWLARRTGYDPVDTVGEPLWEAYPEIADTDVQAVLEHVRSSGETVERELFLDAEDAWIELHAYPVSVGLFIQLRDITQKRERIRELERRNQRLESVARTLSHDLQNPMNVAEGRLELVEETGELSHLEDVARAHNQMQNLINELLRLARAEDIDATEVDFREVVDEAWSYSDTGEMELEADIEAGTLVLADAGQFQRLFENLFENAHGHGDAATVWVGRLDGGFYVADDGSGIPATDEDLFESGVTTAAEGTGYGLAIVQQIAHEHDWEVEMSDSVAGGVRFEVTGVTFR